MVVFPFYSFSSITIVISISFIKYEFWNSVRDGEKKDLDCIKDLIHRFATALAIISEEENSFFNL
tara:strand:+ start:291 stop:485 length:195 start_codon:yes stop_codon:yes gene_type:complete